MHALLQAVGLHVTTGFGGFAGFAVVAGGSVTGGSVTCDWDESAVVIEII